jgi:hypothetical protein
MTAEASIYLGLALAVAASLGLAAYVRWLIRYLMAMWYEAAAVVVASTIFAFAAVLPMANNLGREDPARAPAVFWLILVWVGVVAGVAGILMRPRMKAGECIALVALSILPGACIATPVGAVTGAQRTLHDCEGNLKALGTNFGRFAEDNKRWPAEDKWVNDILPYLDFPMAFRCPSRSDKDYVYHKPPAGAKDDFVLISCVHPFLHKSVVLHKDETVTIDELAPGTR